MQAHNSKPEVHLFICTRTKEKGESCGPKGSADLRDRLKKWIKDQDLHKRVKVTASLCLGHCENGVTTCLYPHNEWFLKVDPQADFEYLKDLLLQKLKD